MSLVLINKFVISIQLQLGINMKLQIIETPDYILAVSDEEIEKWYLDDVGTVRKGVTWDKEYWSVRKDYKKIVAYQPKNNAPELDLPLLPEIDVEDYSLKEAKKFAYSKFKNLEEKYPEGKGLISIQDILETLDVGVECGYRFASKGETKGYSEEEVIKLMTLAWNAGFNKYDVVEAGLESKETDIEVRWILSKFKSPKTPLWFVAETRQYSDEELYKITEFKTTTINGKTYLVGTYLYE